MEYLPEEEQLVVIERTKIDSQGNIDRFTLPKTWAGLEKGKIYAWQVVALCGNPYLRASIQRVDQQALKSRQLADQVNELAQQGIWYDAPSLAMSWDNPQIGMDLIRDLAMAEQKKEPIGMEREYRHSYLLQTIVP
jgi:hypothetical protein